MTTTAIPSPDLRRERRSLLAVRLVAAVSGILAVTIGALGVWTPTL